MSSVEKFIGESQLKSTPTKKFTFIIDDEKVTTAKIADNAITEEKISGEDTPEGAAVTTSKIKDGAVTNPKIADGAVTTIKIQDFDAESSFPTGITNEKLADESVTESKLASGAVTEGKIAPNAVTAGKIAGDAVIAGNIAAGAITHDNLTEECVQAGNIANGAVENDNIANNAVSERTIAQGAVTTDKLSGYIDDQGVTHDAAVTNAKIANGAVTTAKIGDGEVQENHLATGAVTTDKLADGMIEELQTITDDKPVSQSVKPIQSGGVFNAIAEAGVVNISEVNKVDTTLAKYSSLSDALAAVPTSVQRGGMSIKFIQGNAQSSDNKYVQFRYMSSDAATAATFSNVENWQGVDNVPVHDSKNLIESGGVFPTKQAVDDASVEVDNELANGTNYSVYNNSSVNGIGGVLADNVTISKVTVRVGSRLNTNTPNKIYLCLRKDTKDGEVLYSDYVAYSPSDNTMRDCVFDLSSNPVSYEGLIYYQIWSDINIPKISLINQTDYKYTVSSSYTTNNGSSWDNSANITIAYIRYVVGTKRKIEIDSDHLADASVSPAKLSQELIDLINSKASTSSVEELSQTVGGLTDAVATNTEDIEDVQDDVDKILVNYEDVDVWSENAQLTSNTSADTIMGRGNSIAANKIIYKVKLYIGSRSSTSPVTKAKLVLRKDSRTGDILASKTVDFSYTDTQLHYVEFSLDTPVTYSGEIYCTLQCDNAPKIGIIDAADYIFTADVSYVVSNDLSTDIIFVKSNNNSKVMWAEYVYQTNKVLKVGTNELEDECVTEGKVDSDFLAEIKNDDIDLHPGVRAVLPSDIVVTTGSTLQLFYRGIVSAFNPYSCNVEVTVLNRTTGLTAGQAYPRYYQLKATTNKIGTYDMTINVRDDANNIISTASSVIHVIANPSSPSSQKNILVFGASLISPGYVTDELRRRLTLSSGTLDDTVNPLGLGLSNIGFIGRKTGSEITDIHQEATGGWGWNTFDSAGVPRYRFYITDGSGDDIVINETFTMNGLTFTVKEKNITGGDGNISCTFTGTLVGEIPSSGTLELASGNVNYSSYIYENANPFWNPNKTGGAGVDFQYYVDTYCNGDDIDILISSLGVNSMAGETWDKDAIIAHIKDIARAFHTYNANGKFIISSIAVPDPTGGFGYNYGANGAISNYYTIIRRFFEFSELVEDIANDDEFSSYVVHAPVMQESDGENMYPKYEMKVNNRSTTKEKVGANAYHPTSVGYNIIADAIYQSICDVLS